MHSRLYCALIGIVLRTDRSKHYKSIVHLLSLTPEKDLILIKCKLQPISLAAGASWRT